MENEYILWENTISKLGESNAAISNEKLEMLNKCFSDPPENSEYMQKYFGYVYNILNAKVDLELRNINSQEIPFKTFEDRYTYMFYTVGMNIRPIILSLCIIQPSNVIFVHTKDTKENVREIQSYYTDIWKQFKLKEYKDDVWQKLEVHQYDDSQVKATVEKRIDELKNSNIPIEKIAFDLTGGKKSIVNTLFTIASLRNIDTFYVDFERYENDNPVPGTEFLRLQKNPIQEFIQQLKKAFNQLPIYQENLDTNMKELAEHLIQLGLWGKTETTDNKVIYGMHQQKI